MMIGGELVLKQSVIKSRMCSKQYQLNDTNIVRSINHYDVLYPLLSLTKFRKEDREEEDDDDGGDDDDDGDDNNEV